MIEDSCFSDQYLRERSIAVQRSGNMADSVAIPLSAQLLAKNCS